MPTLNEPRPTQPSLFQHLRPTITPQMPDDASNHQKFIEFHSANPHIYQALRALALPLARRGQRMGIKALYEILRWNYYTQTNADDEFKLNNNHCPYYARLLMEQEPELAQFFETRTLRAV